MSSAALRCGLNSPGGGGMNIGMVKTTDPAAREARLAAKLRENLHRRKAQARALDGSPAHDHCAIAAKNESDALPNLPSES
ncbi:hypothetical protein [uncultured Novosphingobium sp.]|uniref:hypothetical protein n=2 Tax=Alphaproteobacteria TaxID=28211 RepID=UPI002583E076|nr:hypothetical protein [uncultured Novosphingobium sp.]